MTHKEQPFKSPVVYINNKVCWHHRKEQWRASQTRIKIEKADGHWEKVKCSQQQVDCTQELLSPYLIFFLTLCVRKAIADLTGHSWPPQTACALQVLQTTRNSHFSSPCHAVQGLLPVCRSPHTCFYRNSHRTAIYIAALSILWITLISLYTLLPRKNIYYYSPVV